MPKTPSNPPTSPPTSAGRPGVHLLLSEPLRAAGEYLSLMLSSRSRVTPGDGHPVVIFPGLASDARAIGPLLSHCQSLGYAAMDWGQGWNLGPRGNLDDWLKQLASQVRSQLGKGAGAPSLIGWSLGGLYARELAKRRDWPIRQVISIGTPFNGAPEQTHAGRLYGLLSGQPVSMSTELALRLRTPPPVPTTSIYSRADGIVAWQACRHEKESALVQDVEVQGSHLGMGWNPQVLDLVADRLLQSPGDWKRHQACNARPTDQSGRACRSFQV